MKASVTIVDSRPKPSLHGFVTANSDWEDYDRLAIDDMTGSAPVIAGILRAIADDLDGLEIVRREVTA